MLNKIKKLFMKKDEKEVEINPPETQEQLDKENEQAILNAEDDAAELAEIQPTAEELAEMKNQGYLEDSAAVVGYASRKDQYEAYSDIVGTIPEGESILDFGCGRGDFYAWHETTFGPGNVDYLGVDANQTLIDIGNSLYDNVNLVCDDWTNLKVKDKKDWCVNIQSNNLRYDAMTDVSNIEYVKSTIDKMYEMCNQGLIISLSSDKYEVENQLTYDAGELASWAITKFDIVAVDHTTNTNQFLIVIYKN